MMPFSSRPDDARVPDRKVCFWHKADIDADAEHVRFWG